MGSTTAAVLAGGCALLVAACFSGDPEGSMGPLPADCRQLAIAAGVNPDDDDVAVVGIRGFAFVPAEITVSVGTEVVWVNCEPAGTGGGDHTSTSDTGEWSSPLLTRGDVFERVFDEAGAFEYHCEPHPFMQGTVTVTP
jgi:plastocyanin